MNQVKLGLVVVATLLLVIALGVWWRANPRKSAAFTHMHCPHCFLEIIYDAGKDGQPCPHCGPSGPKLIATAGAAAEREAGASPIASLVVTVFVMVAAGLVVTYLYLLILQARRAAEEAASRKPRVCRCPFCERKIGYAVTKVGTAAICPRCKTAFTLPEGVLVEEE